jgi:hypothetical protein
MVNPARTSLELAPLYLTPRARIISRGPAKPEGHSKSLSFCSISPQAALRPTAEDVSKSHGVFMGRKWHEARCDDL